MKAQKPNTTDKTKEKPADIAGRIKEKPSYERTEEDVQTNYGFDQKADMDTEGEVTQRQEFAADGLPKTQQYSVDKGGRRHTYDSKPDTGGTTQKNYP